ncbi:MAG: amidohydrolase family protein [Pseudomonadota bacterium]
MLITVHRASDIRRVIDLKSDNPDFNIAIVGVTEGWLVADELAAMDIPVILEPYDNLPARFETLGATGRNAARLIEAGVRTAFAHLDSNSHQARLVLQSAGNAVANGVTQADAIKAITTVPADIFGLASHGRLVSGSVADVVIWDGRSAGSHLRPSGLIYRWRGAIHGKPPDQAA